MKKYYWVVYQRHGLTEESVIDIHPFQETKRWADMINGDRYHGGYALVNWKEITEEEFNLHNELFNPKE